MLNRQNYLLQGDIENSKYYPCLSVGVLSFHFHESKFSLQVPKAARWQADFLNSSEVKAQKVDLFNPNETLSATSGHIRWKENTYCIVQEY